jgi:thiol-disulfide isomerase/thioredoxin
MPRKRKPRNSPQAKFLAIGGIALLVIAILMLKGKPEPAQPVSLPNEPAEAQLDRALQAGQPTLAFFHSNNCQQCLDMMEIVDLVYPEFTGSVVLVDINVYDESNQALLKRVGLQYIPTLIFYDTRGQGRVSVGVMEAATLRQTLVELAGE